MPIIKNRDGNNYSKEVGGVFPVLWYFRRILGNSIQFTEKCWLTKDRFETDINSVPNDEQYLYLPIEALTFDLELLEISSEFTNPLQFSDADKEKVFALDNFVSGLCQERIGTHKLLSYEIDVKQVNLTISFLDDKERPLTMTISDTPNNEFTDLRIKKIELVQGISEVCLKQAALRDQFYAQILAEMSK